MNVRLPFVLAYGRGDSIKLDVVCLTLSLPKLVAPRRFMTASS